MVRDEDLLSLLQDALWRQHERVTAGRRFSELYAQPFERPCVDMEKMMGNETSWRENMADFKGIVAGFERRSINLDRFVTDEYVLPIAVVCVILCTLLVYRIARKKKCGTTTTPTS